MLKSAHNCFPKTDIHFNTYTGRNKRQRITLWALALVLVLVLAACAPVATTQPAAEPAAEAAATKAPAEEAAPQEGVFTYWGGLIFSEEANQMLVDRIEQWGAEKGVDVEVVMINQNETVQRVSAAIESGTMPDALDIGTNQMLLLTHLPTKAKQSQRQKSPRKKNQRSTLQV